MNQKKMPERASVPQIQNLGKNVHSKDIGSKSVFTIPELCAQFLRDNSGIPLLQNVQPQDIENIPTEMIPFIGTNFYGDSIQRVKINAFNSKVLNEVFIVSLIEHKSNVDYDVVMQLLKYMVGIWKLVENESNGRYLRKGFKYPPIIPIVYYEGSARWTADLHLKDRIFMKDVFAEYIPDITYRLVDIHRYSNESLLSREDEMSVIMLLNKVQTPEDLTEFLHTNKVRLNKILQKSPVHLVEQIAIITQSLCQRLNLPENEIRKFVEKVKERNMGYFFENMEKMDIQAERRNTKEARKALAEERKARKEAEEAAKETAKEAAKEAAKETERKTIVRMCCKMGQTKEGTTEILTSECELTFAEAADYVEKYWQV